MSNPTPDTQFADRLQELCEDSNLPAATVCGLLMMQVRMIQDAAKERQWRTDELPMLIPDGWRELNVGEQIAAGDELWHIPDRAWYEVPANAAGLLYDRTKHATVIRKVS